MAKYYKEGLNTTSAVFSGIIEFCNNRNLQLLVTYFPSKEEIYAVDWYFDRYGRNTKLHLLGNVLAEYFAEVSVPYLDLTPLYQEARHHKEPIYFMIDSHMTVYGQFLAAKWIAHFLKN